MTQISREDVRRFLVHHLGLGQPLGRGHSGVAATLERLRCIQLDPLDPMGTNADLVVLARVDGVGRGELHHALRGVAFEHFAKERCLVPVERFVDYRAVVAAAPWWKPGAREARVAPHTLAAVRAALETHGPCTDAALPDHGAVQALDWSGWKGTARATAMALEILWLRCDAVVVGRDNGKKVWDLPERAFGADLPGKTDPQGNTDPAGGASAAWRRLLLDRVMACGLLAEAGGAQWSMLEPVRKRVLELAGDRLERVSVEGSTRPYWVAKGALDAPPPEPDDRLRILGPLDPLLWDRKLVHQVFGFEYVWEVYKPAESRRWGWYVCPLLHQGELVGRLEGRVLAASPGGAEGVVLDVARVWEERRGSVDRRALNKALARHAAACGASSVTLPSRFE